MTYSPGSIPKSWERFILSENFEIELLADNSNYWESSNQTIVEIKVVSLIMRSVGIQF